MWEWVIVGLLIVPRIKTEKTYLYETPVNMNYNFSFSNKGLVVTCKAENYLGRSNDPQILKSVEHD